MFSYGSTNTEKPTEGVPNRLCHSGTGTQNALCKLRILIFGQRPHLDTPKKPLEAIVISACHGGGLEPGPGPGPPVQSRERPTSARHSLSGW